MLELPSGTVTFLFTDIEGSTRLWQDHPEVMRGTLARHDFLIRRAIEEHHGFVFKTLGDAFCASFSAPTDALQAVLALQRVLHNEPWPEQTPIRVRMALHSGVAEERSGDYFGGVLNRVARILSAANGGQTIVSLATLELTRDSMPDDVTLSDKGSVRLKDLTRPEHVFQVLIDGLEPDIRPLRSLEAVSNNLPLQITTLVGREHELTQVKALLSTKRLLTLTGAGGAGKSRLALQVAADLLEEYPDGVWLVDLAQVGEPEMVCSAVGDVLGVHEKRDEATLTSVLAHLQSKSVLLLLDTCEHLLEAAASFTHTLLRSCPSVRVLATSRAALGVPGEQTYVTTCLAVPPGHTANTPDSLLRFESVQLFVERARLVAPQFSISAGNAYAVAAICARLDGLPLAIELAAARLRALTVEQINGHLEDRFRLLKGGSRTAMPRQQTLRGTIDWSYDLLSKGEKAVFARLSVFRGGWSVDAAEAVCSGQSPTGETVEDWEVLDLLTNLLDKSLIVSLAPASMAEDTRVGAAPDPGGPSAQRTMPLRFTLLDTFRHYAAEKLLHSGELEDARLRHRDWFTGSVIAKARIGQPFPMEESDNLRAAFEWSLEDPNGAASGLRLMQILGEYWPDHVQSICGSQSYESLAAKHKGKRVVE